MPRRVAALLIAALAVVVSVRAQRPGTAAPSVVFHFPASFDTTDLVIRFDLRGAYGADIKGRPGVHDYPLETVYDGRMATALKAYAYRPGFGFELVEADLTDGRSFRTISIDPKPLGTTRFTGRIEAGDVAIDGLRVNALHLPSWHCEFFVLMDCGVSSITLTTAPIAQDGTFTMLVPDFGHDPALDRFGPGKKTLFGIFGKGELQFRIGNESQTIDYSLGSGNPRGVLVAESYPAEVRFTIQK